MRYNPTPRHTPCTSNTIATLPAAATNNQKATARGLILNSGSAPIRFLGLGTWAVLRRWTWGCPRALVLGPWGAIVPGLWRGPATRARYNSHPMPEFHAEPYIYLPAISHKSVLVAWGAFYFRTTSKGAWKLVDDEDLKYVHPPR